MHVAHLQTLSSVLGVLTALIAPALLVSACGTFIISTATRLTRNVDQMRMFGAELRQLRGSGAPAEEIAQADRQLARMFRRVMQEQRALTLFYTAAVLFVACSLALGLEALIQVLPNWLPVLLGLIGVLVLLAACALLLVETRWLVAGMLEEMEALREESRAERP